MMTLEQLRIFVAVADREHLTQAAEALHLTPSAVSSAIRVLEDRYGLALFHRTGRRIELTDAGLAFLPVQHEQYDFVVPRARAERPAVAAFN